MTVLFVPRDNSFSAAVAGGSGTVVQVAYTVPAGKRGIVTHARVQGNPNGNAALSSFILIDIVSGGVAHAVIRRDLSGLVGAQLNAEVTCNIDVQAADVVRILSINTGAAAVNMAATFTVREYL